MILIREYVCLLDEKGLTHGSACRTAGKGKSRFQRHLKGSKPCVAKRHRLGGGCKSQLQL